MTGPDVGTPPNAVEHLGWQALLSARNEAHTTTNGLIAATYIADRAMVDADQDRYVPDVFAGDAAVFQHFNRPIREARALLDQARHGVGAIALPYAIALYNDYLVDAVALALLAGVSPPDEGRIPGLASLHRFLEKQCGISLATKPQMYMFEVVRHMRNSVVHGSRVVDDELAAARRALRDEAPNAERDWTNVTKHRLPMFRAGDEIKLSPLDARGSIYAAANLARELNVEVFRWLPAEITADLVVAHYRHVRLSKEWGHTRRERELPKFHARHYAQVPLSPHQLKAAAGRSQGGWPYALTGVLEKLRNDVSGGDKGARKRLGSARRIFEGAPSMPILPN